MKTTSYNICKNEVCTNTYRTRLLYCCCCTTAEYLKVLCVEKKIRTRLVLLSIPSQVIVDAPKYSAKIFRTKSTSISAVRLCYTYSRTFVWCRRYSKTKMRDQRKNRTRLDLRGFIGRLTLYSVIRRPSVVRSPSDWGHKKPEVGSSCCSHHRKNVCCLKKKACHYYSSCCQYCIHLFVHSLLFNPRTN